MKPFNIRDILIDPPLILSPMAGVTDYTFRRLIKRRGGVGLVVSEFISVEGLTRNNPKSKRQMRFNVVALTEDLHEYHLRRGQVGTIVEIFEVGKAFEVEFADRNGRTYETIGNEGSSLMVLQYEPEAIVA